ncbi:unnamed protein product, partial [Polarella glacialis]
AADQDETGEMNLEGCGALLRGFFTFYASDFDWQSEVVSVRLGVRGKLSEDPTETRTSYCSGLPPKPRSFGRGFVVLFVFVVVVVVVVVVVGVAVVVVVVVLVG